MPTPDQFDAYGMLIPERDLNPPDVVYPDVVYTDEIVQIGDVEIESFLRRHLNHKVNPVKNWIQDAIAEMDDGELYRWMTGDTAALGHAIQQQTYKYVADYIRKQL